MSEAAETAAGFLSPGVPAEATACSAVPAPAVPAPGQASAARLARHRRLMGLSGAPPAPASEAATAPAVPGDPIAGGRPGTADTSASAPPAPKAPVIVLTDAVKAPVAAASAGKSVSVGKPKDASKKSLAVHAAPFVLNPAVQDFNPSASGTGDAGAAQGATGQAGGGRKGRERGKVGGSEAAGAPGAKPNGRNGRNGRNVSESNGEEKADGAVEGRKRGKKPLALGVAEEAVGEDDVKVVDAVPGLLWEEVGTEKPESGSEIKNAGLAKALQHRTKFTVEALKKWNVVDLTFENYIEVGGKYFKPSAKPREKRDKPGKRDNGDGAAKKERAADARGAIDGAAKKDKAAIARGGRGAARVDGNADGNAEEPVLDGKGKGKKKAGGGKAGGAWWRTLQEDDPISLEPLNRLRYAPFDLKANADITVWFDPKMLGNYLVSSASFVHPVSRRELTKDDCQALGALEKAKMLT